MESYGSDTHETEMRDAIYGRAMIYIEFYEYFAWITRLVMLMIAILIAIIYFARKNILQSEEINRLVKVPSLWPEEMITE